MRIRRAGGTVVDEWSELDGVHCEVDDLTLRHRPGDILEPEPAMAAEDDHREPTTDRYQ